MRSLYARRLHYVSESVAMHRSVEGSVRVVIAISKRYKERAANPYWDAYHPHWDAFLSEGNSSYLLLGCVDRGEGYALPSTVIHNKLAFLNVTVRGGTGKSYWHIHLVERDGKLALLLPRV